MLIKENLLAVEKFYEYFAPIYYRDKYELKNINIFYFL